MCGDCKEGKCCGGSKFMHSIAKMFGCCKSEKCEVACKKEEAVVETPAEKPAEQPAQQ